MCGIVGYTGPKQAAPILLSGLEKLEYRGYDSAGVAIYNGQQEKISIAKAKGRLSALKSLTDDGTTVPGSIGIGHTRWATHGAPSDINSHPQTSSGGKFAVVHNGIIENYLEIKQRLVKAGVNFASETDTEVLAQLLEHLYDGDALSAIHKALSMVKGSYALGIICLDMPDTIFAARQDGPLIIGLGQDENYIASDVTAILAHTRNIVRLYDGEVAIITDSAVSIEDCERQPVERAPEHIDWDIAAAEKDGYEHFMMKEIMQQPEVVRDTIISRIKDGKIQFENVVIDAEMLKNINRIHVVGCGTAYHVGLSAKYVFEQLLSIPTEVDFASEFRYRSPIVDKNTLVLIISQSGETADTLAALREAKRKGAKIISIVNVVGSTIASESDDVIYTRAGPEISVASTKAYSTQLAVVYLLGLAMASAANTISQAQLSEYIAELTVLPDKIEQVLSNKETVQYFASRHFNANDVYFIGRNVDFPVSLEACLKLKEISYIHSEAYPGGELKHGPISLIEDGTLIVAFACYNPLFEKMMSNIKEVKARGATVLSIATQDNTQIDSEVDCCFHIPSTVDFMLPSLSSIPFQLFAYYVASLRGCDIDKPRNLAKSVTVE